MVAEEYYSNIKDAVGVSSGGEERVEVNQRALIDKILARYASAGAVYRELLQNSNDAEATVAEIYFTTSGDVGKEEMVTNVTYRNNGLCFRPQDWSRLKKIAEGNPDESKIGAFGVGAYTMFSICEDPMVVSGRQALTFFWKGDALWTKTIDAPNRPKDDEGWTCFVLPSRDPYAMPDLVDFGEFLCASLTFTKCLADIRVFVNQKQRLTITKTCLQEPTVVKVHSKAPTSWFSWKESQHGSTTMSPNGLFALKDDQSLLESLYHIQVEMDGTVAALTARYMSAIAKTNLPAKLVNRMERVTKKKPPSKLEVQIFLSHNHLSSEYTKRKENQGVQRIVQSFSPRIGEGRIFIGFRTSQTTGLAAHLTAPFVPTVEREAMDLQDPTLRIFNLDLLDFSGIIMRLTLEHSMLVIGVEYQRGAAQREALEKKLLKEALEAAARKKQISVAKGERTPSTEYNAKDKESETTTTQGKAPSFLGFAKFMAKGVTKTIQKVVTNISELVDDAAGGELIYPLDPRPLCAEERQCILLMKSFCPQQSTPDPLVGTALAQGFSRCIARTAPVLTRSGVLPGDQARLPNKGMEAFVGSNVIRTIIYENAKEYHDVVAQCRKLTMDDLVQKLSHEVLEESKVVRLMKWWAKFYKIQSLAESQSLRLKENIRFFPDGTKPDVQDETMQSLCLRDFLFYLDKDKISCGNGYSVRDIPLPGSVLPRRIQDEVTSRTLAERSFSDWFAPLSVEIWIDFISHHPSMESGLPEYHDTRLCVFSTLATEYRNRNVNERQEFATFCRSAFQNKRCIPFDSTEPTKYAADLPSHLYLYSAELSMFHGLGNFQKVSKSLQNLGVSDEFLLSLGVRKSVSIDFLFENLHTLKYTNDPKPLVTYLRTATLTKADIEKLRATQYLPAENDSSRMFAPAELYLPDSTFRLFPFVRLLRWPSDDDVSEQSLNGKFLISIGINPVPELRRVLRFISDEMLDDSMKLPCLDFVAERLGTGGSYHSEYAQLSRTEKSNLKFLPCTITSPISGEQKQISSSILGCCANSAPGVMGFPVLNLGDKNKLYGNLFRCVEEPNPDLLLQQLKVIVSLAKKTLQRVSETELKASYGGRVINSFACIFHYLSCRSSEIDTSSLRDEQFIPAFAGRNIHWFRPPEVFFKNTPSGNTYDVTMALFHVVDFSPFLASCGVRQEPSTKDIFKEMIHSPKEVFAAVKGEENYRSLLRRIASDPPFRRITTEIRDSAFLLAYTETEGMRSGKIPVELAKARDILVIDNSFFGRMFSVKRAPHESDLEDFYILLGADYISKAVEKKFDVIGNLKKQTVTTKALAERITERAPLLISPSNSSRSLLVSNASAALDSRNLNINQVPELKAIYSLGKSVRTQRTTCCIQQSGWNNKSIFITENFDWFDVGFAIGELILKRCQLEDAFLISSLLEAPLDQLRARGFPLDRIVKTEECSKVGTNSNLSDSEKLKSSEDRTMESSQSHETRISKKEDQKLAKVNGSGRSTSKGGEAPKSMEKEASQTEETNMLTKSHKASKLFGSKKLGKAFQNFGALQNNVKLSGSQRLTRSSKGEHYFSKPEDDALLHQNMEQLLRQKVLNSSKVDANGFDSPETTLNIPEGLDRGDTCEVLPSHHLDSFRREDGSFESNNGIKLFSHKKLQSSKIFMREHYDAVESFAVVLERLCDVFSLPIGSIAIYHDPTGGAIAFNRGGALYFNLRYFYTLHFSNDSHHKSTCYSYWFVVYCHELAHNIELSHSQTHAFYTESYTSLYLPRLITIFKV